MARILRSGKNVVNILGGYNLNTPLTPERDMLDEAAKAGGVSITGGGNMPGMFGRCHPFAHVRFHHQRHSNLGS